MRYGVGWVPFKTTVLVSVYSGDGTVSIVHGGVEIGQGINTKVTDYYKTNHVVHVYTLLYKVAQVAAHTLGIGLSLIDIKPTNSMTNPNGAWTGSSITSELSCQVSINF